MRILVVSDIHGHASALRSALLQQPQAETVIFLGDGVTDWERESAALLGRRTLAVRGNCDWSAPGYPDQGLDEIAGVRVFYTHGHRYGVKSGTECLVRVAAEQGAAVVLYGHTHRAVAEYRDGVHLLCPGALANGEYGLVDILPQGVLLQTCRI